MALSIEDEVIRFSLKDNRRKQLIKQLESIMMLWILENILHKKECCQTLSSCIGKHKEMLDSVYSNMNYWTFNEYLELLQKWEGEKYEDIKVTKEVENKLLGERKETEESKIPSFIGTSIKRKKLHVFSFDEKEVIKDAFAIDMNDQVVNSFSLAQRIIWVFT